MVRQIMDAVHEYERKVIAARTKAHMRAKQKRGQRMGRFAPYGFSIDPNNPKELAANPTEQVAIKRAKELMVEGLNNHAIARRLDQEHLEAARGDGWSARTIGRLRKRI
jgi:DNA invertase Pin-like site-specific DNA recombinase